MLPWVASRRKALPYRHVINILIDSGKFNTRTHAPHAYPEKVQLRCISVSFMFTYVFPAQILCASLRLQCRYNKL